MIGIQAFFIRGGQNWGHRSFFPAHTDDVPEDEVLTQLPDAILRGGAARPARSCSTANWPRASCWREALGERGGVQGRAVGAAARRPAAADGAGQAQRGRGARAAAGRSRRRRRSCCARSPSCSSWPSRPTGSRSTTTAISRAPTRSARWSSRGRRASARASIASSTSRTRRRPTTISAMMREVFRRRFAARRPRIPDRDDGELARPGADRRRRGQLNAAQGGARGSGDRGRVPGRRRQGRVPRPRGARGVPPAGRARTDAAGERAGAVLPPAAARRGPPLRDRRAPREARQGDRRVSPLDEVPGIGPARKKALLMHFGTGRAVRNASLEDLQKAPGVSAGGRAAGLRLLPRPVGGSAGCDDGDGRGLRRPADLIDPPACAIPPHARQFADAPAHPRHRPRRPAPWRAWRVVRALTREDGVQPGYVRGGAVAAAAAGAAARQHRAGRMARADRRAAARR